MKISFGRNAHQELHAFRHVIEAGIDVLLVRSTILRDLEWRVEQLGLGLLQTQIVVEGVLLEYRAFKFPDGSINVGRITLL